MSTRPTYDATSDYADDRTVTRRWDLTIILRLVAVTASAVLTIIGLIAVAQVSWGDDGFDAPPVDVAGITFTPEVAVTVAAAGIIALIASAVASRSAKLVVGALLVSAGVVALATTTSSEPDWRFGDELGWLAIAVGAVLVVVAVLMQMSWAPRRTVHDRQPLAS